MVHTIRHNCWCLLFLVSALVVHGKLTSGHEKVALSKVSNPEDTASKVDGRAVVKAPTQVAYDCKPLHTKTQPIHNQTTWMFLREAYQEAVGSDKANIALSSPSGFKIPHEVRQSTGRGRGVFVTSPVKRGRLIWETKQTAMFEKEDEHKWRKFVAMLPHDLACDVLQWAYVDEHSFDPTTGRYAVYADLDEGSFLNHGKTVEEINAGSICPRSNRSCSTSAWALRDIEEGEELLMNYTAFSVDGFITWFDEMVEEAWDGDNEDSDSEDEDSTGSEDVPAPESVVVQQLDPTQKPRSLDRNDSRFNTQLITVGLGTGFVFILTLYLKKFALVGYVLSRTINYRRKDNLE